MKTVLAILAGLMILTPTRAQEVKVTKGQRIQVESILYANPLPFDSKWGKLKQHQKDALVVDLNKKIESGAHKPWRTTTMKMEYVEVVNQNGAAMVTGKAYDSGFEYQSTSYFTSETSYLVRNADPVYSILNGDTLGMAIQGIQKIPNNIKIGDKLPKYYDFAFTFPKTWTSQMSESVYAGRKSETHHEFGYLRDTKTGEYSFGDFKVTTTSNVYKIVNHQVEISEHITSNIIHYFTAYCSGTEKLTIAGVEETAYIIDSQQWAQSKLNRDYSAERQDLANKTEAEFEMFRERIASNSIKKGYTNSEGYVVSYFKEWFVPGYGVVKSESYDIHGAIQSQSKVIF